MAIQEEILLSSKTFEAHFVDDDSESIKVYIERRYLCSIDKKNLSPEIIEIIREKE